MGRWFLLLIVVVLVLVAGCGGSSQRATYVRANEMLFNELPRFPSSQLTKQYSAAYRSRSNSGPVLGYTSVYEFKVSPHVSTASVDAFFGRRLQAPWLLLGRTGGGNELSGGISKFRRRSAAISINLDNARFHRFEIDVDHAYFGKRGRCGIPGGCSRSPTWVAIRRAILTCRARTVGQTHARDVSVTLKNGRTLKAREARIDAIVDVLNAAHCQAQPTFSTE